MTRERDTRVRDEDVVREESERAGREASRIGGRGSRDEVEEDRRPLSEGGGGEAEGFELAEEDLRDEAEQGRRRDPMRDAGDPEADESRGEYGEADRVRSSEREEPPGSGG